MTATFPPPIVRLELVSAVPLARPRHGIFRRQPQLWRFSGHSRLTSAVDDCRRADLLSRPGPPPSEDLGSITVQKRERRPEAPPKGLIWRNDRGYRQACRAVSGVPSPFDSDMSFGGTEVRTCPDRIIGEHRGTSPLGFPCRSATYRCSFRWRRRCGMSAALPRRFLRSAS